MALSYHELTYDQPRNTTANRQQLLVISSIMAVMLVYNALSAGILAPLDITQDTFPGGEFVYKFMTKDYVASFGTVRTISSDLGLDGDGLEDAADLVYSVYLDDPSKVPGGMSRYACGALLLKGEGEVKRRLMDKNNDIPENGGTMSQDTRYEVGLLPKAKAAVVQHPSTDGGLSALFQRFKIIPALKKYARENAEYRSDPVIISTCSAKQGMCTFYMPLQTRDKFFLGKILAEDYANSFDHVGFLENMGLEISTTPVTVWKGIKRALGMGEASNANEEL